jgi:hypothetical protein
MAAAGFVFTIRNLKEIFIADYKLAVSVLHCKNQPTAGPKMAAMELWLMPDY